MADNTTVDNGTLTDYIVADEELGDGSHLQSIELHSESAGTKTKFGTATNPMRVSDVPSTTGGGSGYHVVAGATNNAASVKASAGQVYGLHVFNNTTYPVFVKLYDKASAPSPGSDTPVLTIGVQAGTQRDVSILAGRAFALGIALAIVKGISDTDNTSTAASDAVVDLDYK